VEKSEIVDRSIENTFIRTADFDKVIIILNDIHFLEKDLWIEENW
jgi:hypothetical protein